MSIATNYQFYGPAPYSWPPYCYGGHAPLLPKLNLPFVLLWLPSPCHFSGMLFLKLAPMFLASTFYPSLLGYSHLFQNSVRFTLVGISHLHFPSTLLKTCLLPFMVKSSLWVVYTGCLYFVSSYFLSTPFSWGFIPLHHRRWPVSLEIKACENQVFPHFIELSEKKFTLLNTPHPCLNKHAVL